MKITRNILKKLDPGALILILSGSAVLAYGYFNRIDAPNFEERLKLHNQIIAGTASSPYRYRLLVPYLVEGLNKVLSLFLPIKDAFLQSYKVYDLLAIFFLLAMLYYWLKTWFTNEQALVGVLFVAATMPIALQNHFFQPWSFLEAGIFSAALLAIHKKRYWILTFLVICASLNRETGVFIPFIFFLTIDIKIIFNTKSKVAWKPILLFGGLLLTWAVVFLGLRYFRGNISPIANIAELFARNTTRANLSVTLENGSLFLGGLWVFACLGYQYAPPLLKKVALIIPFYLFTILLWGVWYEVRLLMPMYPIIVPLGLSFLYSRPGTTQ